MTTPNFNRERMYNPIMYLERDLLNSSVDYHSAFPCQVNTQALPEKKWKQTYLNQK